MTFPSTWQLAGAAVAALSVGWAANSRAAPLLQYQVFDGATLIGSGNSATGIIPLGSGTDANFAVALSATGSPAIPAPTFSNNNFTISSDGVAGVITIKVTDTGLTSLPTNVMNTFTTNSLTGGGFLTDTITNYYDTTNTAYGTQHTLATVTYTGKNSFSTGPIVASVNPPGLYSESTIYTIDFGAGSSGASITASSQIVPIPEPLSLALVGTGLAGIGLLRRRHTIA